MHGCETDLKWLKHDFNIEVVNLWDTNRAQKLIKNTNKSYGLSELAEVHLGIELDKQYKTVNKVLKMRLEDQGHSLGNAGIRLQRFRGALAYIRQIVVNLCRPEFGCSALQ